MPKAIRRNIPSIKNNRPAEKIQNLPRSPNHIILRLSRSQQRQFLNIRLLLIDWFRRFLRRRHISRPALLGIRTRRRRNRGCSCVFSISIVSRLLHEKEQKDKRHRDEDTRPVEYPSPAMILSNKTAYHRGNVVAAGEEEAVQAHVCSPFVGKVL